MCRLSCLLFGCLVLLGACERPFLEEPEPGITVVAPDLSVAFSSPELRLQVSVSAFNDVDTVLVNGEPMAFDPEEAVWTHAIRMRAGLNTLRFTALDATGLAGIDTAYALYLPVSFNGFAPDLPEPRGGHTATLLANGTLLVLGGAPEAGGDALASGLQLRPGALGFSTLRESMHVARTGHTATLLPDGRVLIVGGSRSDTVDELEDLVETIELFDPRTGNFQILTYEGPPIRRAYHTAVVRTTGSGTFIDLFGGRGDIRYGSTPRLGIRQDLTFLELADDALSSRSPAPGPEFVHSTPLWGHTETPLGSNFPGAVQRYLVTGRDYQDGDATDASFVVDYTQGAVGILTTTAALPFMPRTRHAAALLRPGAVVLFGGLGDQPPFALDHPEIYLEAADRFFRLPLRADALTKRYSLTATNVAQDRILLLGGFSSDGNGITHTEVFEAASF